MPGQTRTIAIRFEQAKTHLEKLRHIAEKEITADLPGRQRASAITRARTQYNAVYSNLAQIAKGNRIGKEKPTLDQMADAERLIDEAHRLVKHARRFSK